MKFMQDITNGSTKLDEKTRRRGRSIVRGGKGTASRTVGLLGAIFTYAISCEIVEHNPCRGIKRFPDRKCMRFLSQQEIVRLGKALQKASEDGESLKAVAIIKLLTFTGARKGEIEQLKWIEVDLDKHFLRFANSKTGQKIIPINQAAVAVLAAQKPREGNPFVFPADRSNEFFEGLPKIWRRVRKEASLEDDVFDETLADKWLDVPLDATDIGCKRTGLLEWTSMLGVVVAKLRNRHTALQALLGCRRVLAMGNAAQELPRLVPGRFCGPR